MTTLPPTEIDRVAAQREEMIASLEHFEQRFRREQFGLWLATLIGPWIATLAYLGVYFLLAGGRRTWALTIAAVVAFVAAGRFIIPLQETMPDLGKWSKYFGSEDLSRLSSEEMFWWVSFQDVMVALFLSVHIGFMFRLPWIGHKIAELTVDGELILSQHPWMKRFTFLGLLAFIAFPLAATGSAGGAVFGRLLGLSRWAIFWGSALGGILGNAAMYFLSTWMNDILPQNSPIVKWGGVLIIVLIIFFLERRYAAMKREFVKSRTAVDAPVRSDPPS